MNRLPDLIKNCVTAISTEASPVYYMFGNWVELIEDLSNKGNSTTYTSLRYPLVFLHNDYTETINEKNQRATVDSCKIYLIAQQANKNATTQQRYEGVYTSTLNPLYELLLAEMKKGAKFVKMLNKLEHEKRDLYRLWVGDKQNRLPDFLDAIELNFRDLVYYLKNC